MLFTYLYTLCWISGVGGCRNTDCIHIFIGSWDSYSLGELQQIPPQCFQVCAVLNPLITVKTNEEPKLFYNVFFFINLFIKRPNVLIFLNLALLINLVLCPDLFFIYCIVSWMQLTWFIFNYAVNIVSLWTFVKYLSRVFICQTDLQYLMMICRKGLRRKL